MRRKEYAKRSSEHDSVYARHIYCYLDNNPHVVKRIKRSMNKRYRAKSKRFCKKELELLEGSETIEIIDNESRVGE